MFTVRVEYLIIVSRKDELLNMTSYILQIIYINHNSSFSKKSYYKINLGLVDVNTNYNIVYVVIPNTVAGAYLDLQSSKKIPTSSPPYE